MKKSNLIIPFILLGIALFIYVFYRPDETMACKLFSFFVPSDIYLILKKYINYSLPLSPFMIYSFPASLWVMSATMLTAYQQLSIYKFKIRLLYFPLIYGIGLEILQGFHLTDGTFDVNDLLAVSISWLLAVLFINFRKTKTMEMTISPKIIIFSFLILILADVA